MAYYVSLSSDSHTGKVNLIMNHDIDPDVIVFGSSVTEVGFNSNIIESNINKSFYNLGIDGTPILKSEFLIDEFLSYSKNCDTIIIGLAFFSFSKMEGVTKPGRYLAYKSNVYLKENIQKVAPELHSKLYNVPFYSFIVANHTYYKNAFLGLKKSLNKENFKRDAEKGFLGHEETYNDTRKSKEFKENIQISDETVLRFKNLINKIKSYNITPVLIIAPMHINGQNSFINYDEYIDTAKKIASKTNTRLIDFSEDDIVKNDKYFYNNGHLNEIGALKFSMYVSDSLVYPKSRITK